MKRIVAYFRRRREDRKAFAYYDNYTLFDSIMGGYCGLLKFGGSKR